MKKGEISVAVSLTFIFGLTFSLLIVERYFSIYELRSALFGLSGVYLKESYTSYSDLIDECSPEHTFAEYCEILGELEAAGRLLQVFLICDILLLLLFILEIIGLKVALKRLVSQVMGDAPLSSNYLLFAKWIIRTRYIGLLHPLLLIIGLFLWAIVAEISQIDGKIQMEYGLIIAYFHVGFSLLFSAFFTYYIASSRRLNFILLLKSQRARGTAKELKKITSKIELLEESLDF